MKCKVIIPTTLLIASMALTPAFSWGAEDGAALYKAKCANCHGANGEGKPAMKATALKGTEMTAEKLAEYTTKGEATSRSPHKKGISGVNDAQAKAIAEFIKTLK